MPFFEKFLHASKRNGSLVCVGLDTDPKKIPAHLNDRPNPMTAFNRAIIEATRQYTAAYKLNYAFYLAEGKMGMQALEDTLEILREGDVPVILDVKVGDIPNTMRQYGKTFFENYRVDAITVNPLMGKDTVETILDIEGSYCFVLAVTSNPGASDFLKAQSLHERIAGWLGEGDPTRLGAVVGATNTGELARMREMMPETLFLVPGIGAQGGDLNAVVRLASMTADDPRFMVNSSRGIIYKSGGKDFAQAAGEAANELRVKIQESLKTVR